MKLTNTKQVKIVNAKLILQPQLIPNYKLIHDIHTRMFWNQIRNLRVCWCL